MWNPDLMTWLSSPTIYNIKVQKQVKYLGDIICKGKRCLRRWLFKIIGVNYIFINRWLQREIPMLKKIFLTKIDNNLSQLIYLTPYLLISVHFIKVINRINFNCIWKNKCNNYIRKVDMLLRPRPFCVYLPSLSHSSLCTCGLTSLSSRSTVDWTGITPSARFSQLHLVWGIC